MNDARELRLRMWGALILVLVYVLPIYWPPAAVALEAPSATASLTERLFPGVPPMWVWLRLSALLLAGLLLARPLAGASASSAGARSIAHAASPAKLALTAALLFGLAHLGTGFVASHFGRGAQLCYLAATAVPALILFGAAPGKPRDMRPPPAVLIALCILMGAWFTLRVVPAWHAPRTASATDMWLNFRWLLDAAASDRNLLASRSEISATDAWMLLSGVNFLGPGASLPAFPVVLTIGALWLLAGAAALAILCGVTIHWWAGLVAVAAFLFSPLCLLFVLSPAPFGIPIAVGTAMLVSLWRFHTHRSAAALAGFAALAGIGATELHLLHVAGLGAAVAIVLALRRPRVEAALLALTLCLFLVPTAPSLEQVPTLDQVGQEYVSHRWQWAGLEGVLHAQRGLLRRPTPEQLMYAGVRGPFDIQLATLLMPFAVPRTALRLTGDVLVEPVSAALAAIGIAIALFRARRDRVSATAIAVLAVALLPSFAGSQYDRVSLTRAILLPVSLGVFTALAFHCLAKTLLPSAYYAPAAVVVGAAIAVSGCTLFDVVTPRILGTSATELALEASAGSDAAPVLLAGKEKTDADWLHVERIAHFVPARPLEVAHFADDADLVTPPASTAQVLLWSPGIEEDAGVSRTLCQVMPSATLYELRSRSGLSRLYAAVRDGSSWQPRIEENRRTVADCRSGLPLTTLPVR